MAKHKSRKSTWLDQAKSASLVRYGPELSALTALRAENVTNYHRALHQAEAGRLAEQASIAQSLPQVKAIYDQGELSRKALATVPNETLAGLGPAANAFKVAQLQEVASALGSLAGARTQTQTDLVSRGVRAAESETASRRTALQDYRAAQGKVSQRHLDLLGEMGAFTTSESGRLSDAAATRTVSRQNTRDRNAQSERNSQRSAGIDPATGKPIPGGRLDPKTKTGAGAHPQTRAAHNKLQTVITDAQDAAVPLAQHAMKGIPGVKRPTKQQARGYVDYLLRTGVDDPGGKSEVYDTIKTPTGTKQQRRLNADGTPVTKTTPATKIPKVPAAARGAALDIIFDGHVSAKHLAQLHAAGFSVNDLGLPTQRRPSKPRVTTPVSSPYVRTGPRVA